MESLEIDFTGELTATEERRKVYFMTDAIAEHSGCDTGTGGGGGSGGDSKTVTFDGNAVYGP